MGAIDAFWHGLNFLAPALVIGGLLALASRWLAPGHRRRLLRVWLVNGLVGIGVLAGGLALFDADGKMLTWLALVLAMASVQWAYTRRW